ncbi:cytochrome P450 [Melampsora americana]|nr:cytochrome P450 [Melampsora americana]
MTQDHGLPISFSLPFIFSLSSDQISSTTYLSVLFLLTSLLHAIVRQREPTFFVYLFSVLLALLGLGLIFESFYKALKHVILFNAFLGLQLGFYRLAWHPLRHFHGPPLAALTQFWILREAYLGRNRFTMRSLGEEYGDWVRIGPNELYTTSIEALWTIMGPKGWAKGNAYSSGITKTREGSDSLLTLKTLAEHAPRRRIWDKAFTPRAISFYIPCLEARMDQLLEVLQNHVKEGKNVDFGLQLGYMMYDTMSDMAFGSGIDLLKLQNDERRILYHLGRVVQQAGVLRNVPWLTPLVNALPTSQRKEQMEFREFGKSMLMRRYNQGLGSEIDVFHYLLGEDTETGSRLKMSELAADSTLVIIAGSDTTRITLIALFMYLIRSRECMKLLQTELDSIAPDVTPASLAELEYLNACIKEVTRLQPPSPSSLQRICPPDGAVIDGRKIPGGTKVRFSNWAMHRDARYFSDPDSFNPDRWILPTSSSQRHDSRAFFPFLIGPGTCVAKNLALVEIRMVVANVLTKYNLEFAEGFDDQAYEKSWTDAYLMSIENSFWVKFTPRQIDQKCKE